MFLSGVMCSFRVGFGDFTAGWGLMAWPSRLAILSCGSLLLAELRLSERPGRAGGVAWLLVGLGGRSVLVVGQVVAVDESVKCTIGVRRVH